MVKAPERVYQALHPSGWLIVGLYPPPPDELGQILTKLRKRAQWWSPLDGKRNRRAAADTGLREHRNVLAHAAGFVCDRPPGGWGELNLASHVRRSKDSTTDFYTSVDNLVAGLLI